MIHELVSVAAPGLEAAAGRDGSGFKMRGMIRSTHIDILGDMQFVFLLLYECLLCTHTGRGHADWANLQIK